MKTFAPLAVLCIFAPPAAAQTTAEDVLGRWQTPLVEQPAPGGGPAAYIRQTIAFTPEREAFTVEAFGDPEGTVPLFTYLSEGPWRVVAEHESIDGALAIDLINETSEVTILVDAQDLWAAIGLADCPLAIGEAVSITDCVSGPPFEVADCIDLDLAFVDQGGTRLRMGEGSDRCNTRLDETAQIAFLRME